jgi:selenocysteine lyase/cysteine desulfurase
MSYLRNRPHVCIIEDIGEMKVSRDGEDRSLSSDMVDVQRIPIVSFVHDMLPSSEIVEHCRDHGVICRAGKFLSTDMLWHEMNLGEHDGVVRFSFAHYNTTSDITRTINVLEMLDNW